MDKDHLPLLEDQNLYDEATYLLALEVALTEAVKSLSNVSGHETDIKPINNLSPFPSWRRLLLTH